MFIQIQGPTCALEPSFATQEVVLSMGNISLNMTHKESKALLAMETGGPRLCSKRKEGTVDSGNFVWWCIFWNLFWSCLRFMVAGVFSRCMLVKHLNSHYRVETDCCHDPAVYERINEEIKHWIWKKAPGVRDSRGCPKKEVKRMKNNSVLFILLNTLIFFACFFYPSFLF